MKIQCPSGDAKELSECLACSKCYPLPVKKALLEGRNKKRKHSIKPRFGVTRLVSECLRRSYFDLTEEVPIALEKLWIFSRGHAIHNFFQKNMKPTEIEIFKRKEFSLFEVIGYIDAIEDNILYEFKTTANIPQQPQEHHMLQAQAYFSLLSPEEQEKLQKIKIIYFSLNKIASFDIPPRNLLPLLEAKGTILAQALKKGTAPQKQDTWLCDLCEYKKFCTGEKETTYDPNKRPVENKNEDSSIEVETKNTKQGAGLKNFF